MGWGVTFSGNVVTLGMVDQIVDELNGHREMQYKIANTSANRVNVSQNQQVTAYWNSTQIFTGTMRGARNEASTLTCNIYDSCYDIMQRRLFGKPAINYIATAANTILAAICAAAGVTAGVCPSTLVTIKFDNILCYEAGVLLAKALNLDFWGGYSAGSPIFNIGTKGSATPVAVSPIGLSESSTDRSKQRNGVVVQGRDISGDVIYGYAGDSSGDLTIYKVQQPSDTSTLTAIANSYLGVVNNDSAGTPMVLSLIQGCALVAGDWIALSGNSFINTQLAVTSNHRIVKMVYRQDYVEVEIDRTTVNMGQIAESIDNTLGSTIAGLPVVTTGLGGATDLSGYLRSVMSGMVTSGMVFVGAITSGTIAANAVYSGIIAMGAVVAASIAVGAVVSGKLANDSVITTTIASGQITTDKVAANAINTVNLAAGAVTAGQLSITAVDSSGVIASGSIVTTMIQSGTITTYNIKAGTIEGWNLNINTISANVIMAKAVIADKVDVIGTRSIPVTATDVLRNSNNTQKTVSAVAWTKYKEMKINDKLNGVSGESFRLKFDYNHVDANLGYMYVEVRKNGTLLGSLSFTYQNQNGTESMDITDSFVENDLLQLYGYWLDMGACTNHEILNMRLYYGVDGVACVRSITNQDP